MRCRAFSGLILILCVAAAAPRAFQISDSELGQRVADAVRRYPKFSIFDDVEVLVSDRVVRLEGRVTTTQKKDEIGQLAGRLEGVRSVINEIGVLPVSPEDQRLRTAAANAIYSHPAFWRYAELPHPPIHIIVEHQRITLTGQVDSPVDRTLASSLAQVGGARSVTNRLRVGTR